MNERQTGEGRQDRWSAQDDRQWADRQDDMDQRMQRGTTRSTRDQGVATRPNDQSSGSWSGYVVPYRYYGPGYRGVGYYSVLYQGSEDWDETGTQGRESRSDWQERGGQRDWQGGRPSETRRQGGGFAGRGPKGYQRTDERIREDLSDTLMADDRIDASDIEVAVKDGEVTLTGTVDDRQSKRLAEDLAEQVMGVREVMNQIRVDAGWSDTSSSSGGSTVTQGDARPAGSTTDRRSTPSQRSNATATSGGRPDADDPMTTEPNGQKAGSTPR